MVDKFYLPQIFFNFVRCFHMTLKKNYKKIIPHFFAGLGFCFSAAEFLDCEVLFNLDIGYNILRSFFVYITLIILIVVFVLNWESSECSSFINGTDIKITLKMGNIFNTNGSIIVPVNTNFDTSIHDGLVNEYSIQGQFQNKYFRNNVAGLDLQIEKALSKTTYTNSADKTIGKTKLYPIGTACKINTGRCSAYFFAAADISDDGRLSINSSDIHHALISLWESINNGRVGETLLIPLIWTGSPEISGVNRDSIIKEILYSFISFSKSKKITEHLMIFINPKDNKNINWNDACEYMNHICKFGIGSSTDNRI